MTPTSLIHLSADTLRERAHHAAWHSPAAAPAERKWAGVACLVIVLLAVLLIVAAR